MISESTARLLDLGWRLGEMAHRHGFDFEFCRWAMAKLKVPVRARKTVRCAFFRAMKEKTR